MGRCKNDCSVCREDYCENSKANCSVCGEEFPTGELFREQGRYYCLSCFAEREERFGKIKSAKGKKI